MRGPDYYAYISGPGWRKKANTYWSKAGRSCKRCGSVRNLDVHHLTYERFKRERMADLLGLCRTCHIAVHTHHAAHPALSILEATRAVTGLELADAPAARPRLTPKPVKPKPKLNRVKRKGPRPRPTGQCQACGRDIKINADGFLAQHSPVRHQSAKWCAGSGRTPAPRPPGFTARPKRR